MQKEAGVHKLLRREAHPLLRPFLSKVLLPCTNTMLETKLLAHGALGTLRIQSAAVSTWWWSHCLHTRATVAMSSFPRAFLMDGVS